MLTKTSYFVPKELLDNLIIPDEFRSTINQPTGRFFYDPWELRPEFKNTLWETIYNSLPVDKGEARIIILEPGTGYKVHADIDDRYHLNISGDNCYLLDLDNNEMFAIEHDGVWYDLYAGGRHTAANFGIHKRVQLVVRKLLTDTELKDPVKVKISPPADRPDARFLFDNTISPWLNSANKNQIISDFFPDGNTALFHVERLGLASLTERIPDGFKLDILV